MNFEIGLQLYSLREQLASNFEKTLEEIAKLGFTGVEFAGLHNQKPERVLQLLSDLNLKPVAMHGDLISSEGVKRMLDEAMALNCDKLVCPWCPPERFKTKKNIQQLADQLNSNNELIKAQDKILFYHNHAFEFVKIDKNYGFTFFEKHLDTSIYFELDTYLAKVGGAEPLEIIKTYPDRIKMLHLKDGTISPSNPNLPIGEGKMDYVTILGSLPQSINWVFIEFEDCATNKLKAIHKSLQNIETMSSKINESS